MNTEPQPGWRCGICQQIVPDEAMQERPIIYPDGVQLIGPVHVDQEGRPIHDLAKAFNEETLQDRWSNK